MSMYDRYNNDPMFHALVEKMLHLILDAQFTPTEIREAAMLAQIRVEQLHPRPIQVVATEKEGEENES